MKESPLESLTSHLDRVERENRRLTRVGAAVALGIAAAVLMGQAWTTGRLVEAEAGGLRQATQPEVE